MPFKRLTLSGETADLAIRDGLERIGLEQADTYVEILQKETQGLFGHNEATVAITFDAEQSEAALREAALNEFKSKFITSWKDEHVQILIPPSFYENIFFEDNEARLIFLRELLDERAIDGVDDESLVAICEHDEDSFDPFRLKPLDCEPLNEQGSSIWLRVDGDGMKAEVIIFNPEATNKDEVLKFLANKGITHGIRLPNLQRVLGSCVSLPFVIASGQAAQDDRPGPVEKFFQEDEHKQFSEMMAQLTIDTRAVKEINIAERHQLLMKLGDFIPGSDGYNIKGERIKRKRLDATDTGIQLGPNVYFSDNKKEIYSKEPGHIVWEAQAGLIDVEPVYIVDGNVDFSEGNILGFVGKVIVKGDVKPQFSIVAERDIEIQGSVEDATVKSTHGNVFVGGSIIHRSGGSVQAAKTVHCNIVKNAVIRADTIMIEKEAMNSELTATSKVVAEGNPGAIIGGVCDATYMIRSNVIGSDRGVQTHVRVGDVTELKAKLRKTQQRTTRQEAELKEAQQVFKILSRRQREHGLTASQEEQLERTKATVPQLQEALQFAHDEEANIKEEIKQRKNSRLEILKTLYPQVDVHIFEAKMIPRTAEQYTGLRCSHGAVKRYSL